MIKDLPLRKIQEFVEVIRKSYFTVTWKDWPNVVVSGTPTEIEDWFRTYMHAEGMLQAYYYEGEEMNLRIPWGTDDENKQLEFHVRARTKGENVELIAHIERSRYEHKQDHIKEIGFSWDKGVTDLVQLMDDSPFDVKEVNDKGAIQKEI